MREPDFEGPGGKAWNIKSAIPSPTLASYLIYAPYSHPVWPYKWLSIIHLRDEPGIDPPTKYHPEAEYELILMPIDPEAMPHPDPDEQPFMILVPPDVMEQFHGITDDEVKEIGAILIQNVIAGLLIPDQDWRRHWRKMLDQIIVFIKNRYKETG